MTNIRSRQKKNTEVKTAANNRQAENFEREITTALYSGPVKIFTPEEIEQYMKQQAEKK